MRTPARPRLPDGDCVFISDACIVARADAPFIAADMTWLGFAPRCILVHIASSISKLYNNSSFEIEKELAPIARPQPARQLMIKPPETTHSARRWRRLATWVFANGVKATCADSLAVEAGGLHAKGRLSFKTGGFGAIEPPKAARHSLWDKNENSTP